MAKYMNEDKKKYEIEIYQLQGDGTIRNERLEILDLVYELSTSQLEDIIREIISRSFPRKL